METNEISEKANGGTELMQRRLYSSLNADYLDQFQIICSRVRALENKPRILWLHDTAGDPEVQFLRSSEELAKFERLVFVSHYQQNMYKMHLGVPFSKGIVIENGIEPFNLEKVLAKWQNFDPQKQINIVYTPTPQRGLAILIPAFRFLAQTYKNIHLHVFSSFKLYGQAHRDEQYKELFDVCNTDPNITYHGTVSNDELRNFLLNEAHIFAYPSIWEETSCLCLIEAMSAGLLCVHSNLGALPETSGGITYIYNVHEDAQRHCDILIGTLAHCIEHLNSKSVLTDNLLLSYVKAYADLKYNWPLGGARRWRSFLNTIIKEKTHE
jgi:glycosyltransferase involved in cell wall biosynthesis